MPAQTSRTLLKQSKLNPRITNRRWCPHTILVTFSSVPSTPRTECRCIRHGSARPLVRHTIPDFTYHSNRFPQVAQNTVAQDAGGGGAFQFAAAVHICSRIGPIACENTGNVCTDTSAVTSLIFSPVRLTDDWPNPDEHGSNTNSRTPNTHEQPETITNTTATTDANTDAPQTHANPYAHPRAEITSINPKQA